MPYLDLLKYYDLSEDYEGIGRHYTTPGGNRYPSVTTILGQRPKPGLDEWRERLGDEAADRQMKRSARVGTEMHDACEDYIMGRDVGDLTMMANRLYQGIKGVLSRRVGRVYGTEIPLWSDYLKTAGRSDLIAEFDGEPAIIDYKNSKSAKDREYCYDYFYQGTAYSRMFHDVYGIAIKKIVIIIGEWGRPQSPNIQIEQVKDWYQPTKELFFKYNPLLNGDLS